MKKPETYGYERVYVKPLTDPVSGGPFRTRHPSNIRVIVPAEGAFVPLDTFTRRQFRDGSWERSEPPKNVPAPVATPSAPEETKPRKRSAE